MQTITDVTAGAADATAAGLRFELTSDVDALAQRWRAFERTAVHTPYQTYAYLSAWCRTAAASHGESPLVLLAHDANGLAFIWPLAVRREAGFATLTWLAQAHGSLFFGLWRPGVAEQTTAANLRAAFAAVRRARPGVAAAVLEAQPEHLGGVANPFRALPQEPYPIPVHVFDLAGGGEALMERTFDKRQQKELRRKARILGEMGASLMFAGSREERVAVHDAFLAQKSRQLCANAERNVYEEPGIAEFYRALAEYEGDGSQMVYGAVVREGQIVATTIGLKAHDRYCALQLSMDAGDLTRAAPGQILLGECARRLSDAGVKIFDFGPGEGRHKSEWKCRVEQRFATYLMLDARGLPATVLRRARWRARQVLIDSPGLQRLAAMVRTPRGRPSTQARPPAAGSVAPCSAPESSDRRGGA